MTAQFIGEKIDVDTGGTIKQPVAFQWQGKTFRVTAIIATWFDWGFSPGAKQRDWRTRRHRNYFRVRADSGDVFEIYLDRARGPGEWYLYQKLDEGETTQPFPRPSP
jgi:hypothetical protein